MVWHTVPTAGVGISKTSKKFVFSVFLNADSSYNDLFQEMKQCHV